MLIIGRKITFSLLFVLAWVLATATGSAAGASPENSSVGKSAGGEYLLGVGDLIEVQVWREAELSRTLQVRLDGRISLPLLGDLEAAGKSPRELAARIEERYRETLAEPSVTVILERSNQRYYVIGQVRQPGEFPLDGPLTVLQALARSGGFLEWAKTSNIAVIRRGADGEKLIPFDYDALVRRGDLGRQLLLAPGDTIVVP
ncbi:polysaccharide biosynthesis/export family protein [Desulfurivibrio sp. D14AmB]|uniref:polysaccharide biosynthesis/export family protein n=1 Tax=Desulfurivibrio sp. D14AmB TaxID=3374370 RepID=UPI00376EAF2F